MSPRTFVSIVSAAGLALIVAIALIIARQVSADEPVVGGGLMFPELSENLDDLARLQVETARYILTLELRGDQWVAVEFGDYPVDLDPVLQIVSSIANMTRVEAKTDNPDLYGYIGVEGVSPTSGTIRLSAFSNGGDQLMDAIFGTDSTSIGFTRVGGTFVRPTDEERSWLVEGVVFAPSFLQDWFKQLFSVPGPDVASVTITEGNELRFAVEKINFNTADYELTFLDEQLGPAESIANDAGIRGLTQGIISTRFDDARPIETVTFGPDARTLVFTTRTGLTLEVRLGEADGEAWVAYTASAPEGAEAFETAAEIAAKTQHWAFRVPSYRITALSQPIDALILPPPEEPVRPLFNPAAP